MKKTGLVLAWVMVVLWMAGIFAFSAQPANMSGELSKEVTEAVVRLVAAVFDLEIDVITGSSFYRYHYLVRKTAHGTLYFILGILMMNGLVKSGREGVRAYGVALVMCVLYAISDEVHQLYVPGRGGQAMDVIIDSVGVLLGLGIYYLALGRVKVVEETIREV